MAKPRKKVRKVLTMLHEHKVDAHIQRHQHIQDELARTSVMIDSVITRMATGQYGYAAGLKEIERLTVQARKDLRKIVKLWDDVLDELWDTTNRASDDMLVPDLETQINRRLANQDAMDLLPPVKKGVDY